MSDSQFIRNGYFLKAAGTPSSELRSTLFQSPRNLRSNVSIDFRRFLIEKHTTPQTVNRYLCHRPSKRRGHHPTLPNLKYGRSKRHHDGATGSRNSIWIFSRGLYSVCRFTLEE